MKSGSKIVIAAKGGVETNTRSDKEIAVDVGCIAFGEFGKGEGYQLMVKHAPVPRQRLWQKHDVVPRAIDREVVEAFHRNTMGVGQGYKILIKHASRVSLADEWSAAILAIDLQDLLLRKRTQKLLWRVS